MKVRHPQGPSLFPLQQRLVKSTRVHWLPDLPLCIYFSTLLTTSRSSKEILPAVTKAIGQLSDIPGILPVMFCNML